MVELTVESREIATDLLSYVVQKGDTFIPFQKN
jgi:hypothetical protein